MSFELSDADAGSSPRFRATSVTDNLLPWYDMTLIAVDVSEERILFYFATRIHVIGPFSCFRYVVSRSLWEGVRRCVKHDEQERDSSPIYRHVRLFLNPRQTASIKPKRLSGCGRVLR